MRNVQLLTMAFKPNTLINPPLLLHMIYGFDMLFYGILGSFNDINVLDQSPIFNDLRAGRAPPTNFEINEHHTTWGTTLLTVST